MITAQTIITVVILYLVIINVGICDHGVDKKSHLGVPGAHLGGFFFFSRRFWVAVWDAFWECSTSVIRSTGISVRNAGDLVVQCTAFALFIQIGNMLILLL